MAVTDTLAHWGISRAAEVVELADAAGLERAVAAAVLMRESAGGLNIWGHDAVNDGGIYVKGSSVTRETYLRYKECGLPAQGCGPLQLTNKGLQLEADKAGGCWLWEANVRTGFGHMASLIRAYGLADGMRRYNGSGPWAIQYRDEMLQAVSLWRGRLGADNTAASPAAATPFSAPVLPLDQEDDLMASIPIVLDPALRFHQSAGAEAGGGSAVASSGWITFGSTYGGTTWTAVAALGANGEVLGYWPNVRTTNNTSTSRPLPAGTRHVTVEGQADNEGTRPWASVWCLR